MSIDNWMKNLPTAAEVNRRQAIADAERTAANKAAARKVRDEEFAPIFNLLGKEAPGTQDGDDAVSYTKHVLDTALKQRSPTYHDKDISKTPDDQLSVVKKAIFEEVKQEYLNPTALTLPEGNGLTPRIRKDELGIARFKDYIGKPNACWDQFRRPNQLVVAFKNPKTGHVDQCIPEHLLGAK
jgi:hypothetical protein